MVEPVAAKPMVPCTGSTSNRNGGASAVTNHDRHRFVGAYHRRGRNAVTRVRQSGVSRSVARCGNEEILKDLTNYLQIAYWNEA